MEGFCRPQFEESGNDFKEVRRVFEPGKGFAPSVLCLVMDSK